MNYLTSIPRIVKQRRMASSDESDHLQTFLKAEEEGVDKDAQQGMTEDKENDSIAEDDDILTTKILTNQPTNIQGQADSAYAVLCNCLNNPEGALPRQPTDADWIRYGFTTR